MSQKELTYTPAKIISVKRLSVIKKHGLHLGGKEYSESITNVFDKPEAVREVCNAIFEEDFTNVAIETELDLSKIHDGVQSFLSRLWERSNGSTPTEKN